MFAKTFVMLMFMALFARAEHPGQRKNYYLLLSYDQANVELGEYVGGHYRMKKIFRSGLDSLTRESFMKAFGLEPDTTELFVYIHCWLGNEKTFHRLTLRSLNETTSGCDKIKKTLSIIWMSGVKNYGDSWTAAGNGGRRLSKVFQWLGERQTGTTSFFCHSMGNKIFEGMVEQADLSHFHDKGLCEVVLAAADIDPEAFSTGLRELPHHAQRIHILVHSKDRMLSTSSRLRKHGRMGLNGPEDFNSLLTTADNIYIADVSAETPFESFDPSNHVYFYKGKLVRKYLTKVYRHENVCDQAGERIIRLNYSSG